MFITLHEEVYNPHPPAGQPSYYTQEIVVNYTQICQMLARGKQARITMTDGSEITVNQDIPTILKLVKECT